MFRKLRNKFIWTNMILTTIVIVIAFSSIFVATAASHQTPVEFKRDYSSREMSGFESFLLEELENDRRARLTNLGIILILVGVSIELLVFCVSYYLAERSITPVKEAYNKQKEFIANASHELKTPIAAARANFEALGTTEQPWTDNVDTELDRASKLVNDLLLLARTDGRTVAAKKKEIDLVKLIQKRTQLMQARLGKKVLEIDAPESAKVPVAEADLAQVMDILLDNAVKYSKSSIVVKITTKEIIVTNDGKTITPDKIKKIFDRFYQTDKTAEGSGLGLAIAKSIADQNNWKLSAKSDKKTTNFSLVF